MDNSIEPVVMDNLHLHLHNRPFVLDPVAGAFLVVVHRASPEAAHIALQHGHLVTVGRILLRQTDKHRIQTLHIIRDEEEEREREGEMWRGQTGGRRLLGGGGEES